MKFPSYWPPAFMLPRARINEGLVKCNRAEAQGGPSGKPAGSNGLSDLQIRPAADSRLPNEWLLLYSAPAAFSPEQSVASFWKIPWVRRQRARLRRPLHILLAPIVVNYIKLVINTSTIVADPPDYEDRGRNLHPSIIGLWHGQFFLLPAIYPRDVPGRAIVARHEDAEALARILRSFGLELVRGAGAAGRSASRDRGGTEAAHGLIASLREGFSVALTADVPPGPARKAGPGIVMISSRSGGPVGSFSVGRSLSW